MWKWGTHLHCRVHCRLWGWHDAEAWQPRIDDACTNRQAHAAARDWRGPGQHVVVYLQHSTAQKVTTCHGTAQRSNCRSPGITQDTSTFACTDALLAPAMTVQSINADTVTGHEIQPGATQHSTTQQIGPPAIDTRHAHHGQGQGPFVEEGVSCSLTQRQQC